MEDIEANIEKLKAVRALGVEIAIDDFGTGYSSLQYIARLPITALKIDCAFVHNMSTEPNDMMMVSTIISLAHNLSLKVIAEGVETEEQSKLLGLLRCDEVQGYLFSKPVPAEQIEALLRKTASAVLGVRGVGPASALSAVARRTTHEYRDRLVRIIGGNLRPLLGMRQACRACRTRDRCRRHTAADAMRHRFAIASFA